MAVNWPATSTVGKEAQTCLHRISRLLDVQTVLGPFGKKKQEMLAGHAALLVPKFRHRNKSRRPPCAETLVKDQQPLNSRETKSCLTRFNSSGR